MLNAAQVRRDFNKLRDVAHEHGEVVVLGFAGRTCRALKSTQAKSVRIHEYGEEVGDLFTVRFLVTDFPTLPAEKDVVTVDGVEYQVGEVRFSAFGQIVRAFLMDGDA